MDEIYVFKMMSKSQWNYLEQKIQSPDTTISMKDKINFIIFHRHLPLAHSLTNKFLKFHRYKGKNICKDDLLTYAHSGLYSSVRKYKGNSNFVKYASIYINGGLYKGLTIHYPINKLTKHERRKKYSSVYSNNYDIYDRRNIYLGNKDFLKKINDYHNLPLNEYYDKCKTIWEKIDIIEPFDKRCFILKFDFECNKIRSNKHISELMCCSEETVRQSIYRTIIHLI